MDSTKCHKILAHQNGAAGAVRPLNCSRCPQSFSSMDKLKRHTFRHVFKQRCCPLKGFNQISRSIFSNIEKQTQIQSQTPTQTGTQNQIHTGTQTPTVTQTQTGTQTPVVSLDEEEDKYFKCEQCEQLFMSEFGLRGHLASHFPDESSSSPNPTQATSDIDPYPVSIHVSGFLPEDTMAESYCCSYCHKSFTKYFAKAAHEKLHSSKWRKGTYKCGKCHKSFTVKSVLRLHEKTHSERKYECNTCSFTSASRKKLKHHKKKHHAEKTYKCQTCQLVIASKTKLSKHMLVHANKKLHKCMFCERSFRKKKSLAAHENKNHVEETVVTEEPVVTSEYDSQTETVNVLNTCTANLQWTSKEIPHYCDECGKCFAHKSTLTSHMKTHVKVKQSKISSFFSMGKKDAKEDMTSQKVASTIMKNDSCTSPSKTDEVDQAKPVETSPKKPFKCDLCGKCYVRHGDLTNHSRTCTPEGKKGGCKDIECDVCGKGFSRRIDLKRHAMTHSGVKPHICQHCGIGFARMSNMRRHENKHTGAKSHKCQHCDETFNSRDDLVYHERSKHKQGPKYECKTCGKECASLVALKFHEKAVHLQEKSHQCEFCAKGFVQKCDLTVHERIHTGERPYKCANCEGAFASKIHLNRHEKRRHTVGVKQIYKCSHDTCQKEYAEKRNLKIHKSQDHEKKPRKTYRFSCNECGKEYTSKRNLKMHEIQKHLQKKPFKLVVALKNLDEEYGSDSSDLPSDLESVSSISSSDSDDDDF